MKAILKAAMVLSVITVSSSAYASAVAPGSCATQGRQAAASVSSLKSARLPAEQDRTPEKGKAKSAVAGAVAKPLKTN